MIAHELSPFCSCQGSTSLVTGWANISLRERVRQCLSKRSERRNFVEFDDCSTRRVSFSTHPSKNLLHGVGRCFWRQATLRPLSHPKAAEPLMPLYPLVAGPWSPFGYGLSDGRLLGYI